MISIKMVMIYHSELWFHAICHSKSVFEVSEIAIESNLRVFPAGLSPETPLVIQAAGRNVRSRPHHKI